MSKSSGRIATPRNSRVKGTKKSAVVTPEQQAEMIAEAAYFLAEHRGFAGGTPLEDWLQAEAEIKRMIH